MVNRVPFGNLKGQPVELLELADAASGLRVELLTLGAAIRALWVPDRKGNPTDVVLGYDTAVEYAAQDACFGGTIGRCANRIAGAAFSLDGTHWPLTANEGANQLHGGAVGFHKRVWTVADMGETHVTFTLDSPHGEEGYPGNLHTAVTYTLAGNTLTVGYGAVTDADTVVNLTNHAYFNLAGHTGGLVADHRLTLPAGRYTPCGPGNVPTGDIAPVEGTLLDLRGGATLGERWEAPFLADSRGYDHNFVLEGGPARLHCPRTGITLEVDTTLEGMQLYTAGFLTPRPGKNGALYGPRHAVCLEPQRFPDAIHHPAFPSPVLRAGEVYEEGITYRFSAT